jgi:integrase
MKRAKIPDYILVRSGTFYVRMSVPAELRHVVGKTELKRSLNTKNRTEAALLAPPAIASFQRQLAEAASQCTPVHTTVTEIPIEDARQFAKERLDRMQAMPDQSRARGRQFLNGNGGDRARRLADNKGLLAFFEELEQSDQWASWRNALGRSTVQAYETERDVQVGPHSIAKGLLSELGAEIEFENLRRAIHRDENRHSTAPAPNSSKALEIDGAGLSVSQLLAAYRAAKEPTWKPSSAVAFVKVERLLCDWFGRDRSISAITRENWRELFNALPTIPTGYTRIKAFRGLTVKQVIEAADAMHERPLRLSAKSCGDYVIHVNSLLNWAAKEEVVPKNLAKDLTPPRSARAAPPRRPFDVPELQRLFAASFYRTPATDQSAEGLYWLPLIALFTGMRSGEIARLKAADISDVGGITCFRLTDADALKSKNAVRDVPVHSELRRLGFLDFVSAQAASAHLDLFPDIRRNGKDDQSSEFSKAFRKALNEAGLRDPTLTMHSFRHSFAHALVALQTTGAVADALLGWGEKKPRNMFIHYGGRPPIHQLAAVVEQVNYPGLDLRHLYTCPITTETSAQRRQFD